MSKVLKMENIRTQKNSCVWCPWESIQPLLSTTWLTWASWSLMKVCQPAAVHKNPVDGLCRSSLPISEVKHCGNKSTCGVSHNYCYEAEIKLANWCVQYCNSVWEVLLKSHVAPEKKASSSAELTTVHHNYVLWLFSGCLSKSNSIFFPVSFSSFLLLLLPFSFLLEVWMSV